MYTINNYHVVFISFEILFSYTTCEVLTNLIKQYFIEAHTYKYVMFIISDSVCRAVVCVFEFLAYGLQSVLSTYYIYLQLL